MTQRSPFKRRADALRRELRRHELEGLLVTQRANVRYLTGFSGTAGSVLLTQEEVFLIVDFRYFEQAALQAPQVQRVHVEGAYYERAIATAVEQSGVSRLAFEADVLSYADYLAYTDALPGVEWVPSRGLVAVARELKDAQELALIRRSAAITSQAVAEALAALAAGQREREVAFEIERRMLTLGAEGSAFRTLVAFGEHSALPHPQAGDRALRAGDWVLIDAGAVVEGYCADMTRTVVFGEPSHRQHEIWQAVQDALARGLAAIAPGKRVCEVDAACRNLLTRRGLAEYFGHATGHGVGLELHEAPRVARDSDETLEAGMVLTVEPGVYLPGWGGVRLEELVLVTAEGSEVLTTAPLCATPLSTLTH